MALIHHFMFAPACLSKELAKYRAKYILNGKMERYENLASVPKPIDSIADDAAGSILTEYYQKNKIQALAVDDKHICKKLMDFSIIESYFIGFVPCMGLNYYGFTLIPNESLPRFIDVLKRISVRNNFRELILMCERAYITNCDILHCGI